MTSLKYFLLAAMCITCISAAPPAANSYTLSKGYTVGIHGTSNLHAWDETVGVVTGDGTIDWNRDGSFNLGAMKIVMGVNSIKSREGAIMNNNTYKALKSDRYPEITFVLKEPVASIPASAGGHTISARVNLTIAGVTKSIEMKVTATTLVHENIVFEGSQAIKMTDFGIKPPVALFGTLKTGNDITIHFKTAFTSDSPL